MEHRATSQFWQHYHALQPHIRSNPAKEGSTVTICATGLGALSPAVYIDGIETNTTAIATGPLDHLPGTVYRISVEVPQPSNFSLPHQVAVSVEANGIRSQGGLALSVSQKRRNRVRRTRPMLSLQC